MSENVKSALRVLMVVELLTAEPQGLTFVEVCERLDLPKSSASALLRTMTDRGHLALDESTRTYRLGVRVLEAGAAMRRELSIVSLAEPYLAAVAELVDETVQMALLDGTDVVYVAKVEARRPLHLVSEVGSRIPAHATSLGKALLASRSDADIRRRYRGVTMESFTDTTITSVADLLRDLQGVRERGYAFDNSEYTFGVACVAVPIHDAAGEVVAAMSASTPIVRFDDAKKASILAVLKNQEAHLAARLRNSYRAYLR